MRSSSPRRGALLRWSGAAGPDAAARPGVVGAAFGVVGAVDVAGAPVLEDAGSTTATVGVAGPPVPPLAPAAAVIEPPGVSWAPAGVAEPSSRSSS